MPHFQSQLIQCFEMYVLIEFAEILVLQMVPHSPFMESQSGQTNKMMFPIVDLYVKKRSHFPRDVRDLTPFFALWGFLW